MSEAAAILAAYPQAGAALAAEIPRVAANVGADAYDLANLINFETAKTFSPGIQNSIGATGLIQFIPSTAKDLGTSTDALKRMSAVEQMQWVEKYLRQYSSGGRLGTVQGLYMAVFYPVAQTWDLDKEFPAKVQKYNPGIRTVRDYVDHVNKRAKLPGSHTRPRGSLPGGGSASPSASAAYAPRRPSGGGSFLSRALSLYARGGRWGLYVAGIGAIALLLALALRSARKHRAARRRADALAYAVGPGG